MSVRIVRGFAVAILAIALLPATVSASADQPAFAVGQEWTVKAPDSGAATPLHVVVAKIEPIDGHTIVHISLTGIACPGSTKTVSLGHAPIDADTLAASVESIVATNAAPAEGFETSYASWKARHGGVWTIGVPEIVATLLREVGPQQIGCN
jgi:hypothetical protein